MRHASISTYIKVALGTGLLLLGSALARADESAADSGWEFAAAVYLWGADIGGETRTGAGIDVSFNDLLDSLNAGFMGSFGASKDKWSILADVVYLDVSDKNTSSVTVPVGPGIGPGPIPVDVDTTVKTDLRGTVFQLIGGYNLLADPAWNLDLVAGTRYLDLDSTVKVDLTAMGRSREEKFKPSNDVWDGVVGVKGRYALNPRWSIPFYADIGTGESDFTWHAMTGISYQAAKWADIALVYRYMAWDINGDLVDNIDFGGPALGAIFRW